MEVEKGLPETKKRKEKWRMNSANDKEELIHENMSSVLLESMPLISLLQVCVLSVYAH